MAKLRADQLIIDRGLAESRTRAQALIMAGLVLPATGESTSRGRCWPRRGDRDEGARPSLGVARRGQAGARARPFRLGRAGAVAIDIGSSTGGFTDVLLPGCGAGLCGRCRAPTSLPGSSARTRASSCTNRPVRAILTAAQMPEPVDLVVCDASFIGLAKVLRGAAALRRRARGLVALIKPQFEAGRGEVGKGGVVRDPAVHRARLRRGAPMADGGGWTVEGSSQKPDHRARGQCRIPDRGAFAGRVGDRSFGVILWRRACGELSQRS